MDAKIHIFSGSASKYLAKQISEEFGNPIGKEVMCKFCDGEFQPSFEETIRGSHVYLVQSTFAPSDNLMELLLMIDAAKRASAKQVVAVIPYYGFARQDRKDKPRVPIGAKLIANLLTAAGVNRVITMDLHADQIQGFFDVPVDHMYASAIFVPYVKSLNLDNLVIASPDTGGTRRASAYARFLNSEMVICYKQRVRPNEVDQMVLIGEVRGKDVILIDDIVDTGVTITKAAEMIMKNGAKSVRGMCTHPILSGNACERIEQSVFEELVVTDTIPLKKQCSKIKVLSTAKLFADVIRRVDSHKSISSHFEFTTIL